MEKNMVLAFPFKLHFAWQLELAYSPKEHMQVLVLMKGVTVRIYWSGAKASTGKASVMLTTDLNRIFSVRGSSAAISQTGAEKRSSLTLTTLSFLTLFFSM